MEDLADKIAQLCFDKYNSLKKTGKPKDNEWTVLAGIVVEDDIAEHLSVVSLATGTKCLSGAELMDTKKWEIGSRLSDSHAEVLARQTPCGDCSIFPKTFGEGRVAVDVSVRKRKIEASEEIEVKRVSLGEDILDNACNDIHRTGAKCVDTEETQDPHLPGINYHVIGPLRIKPGRGDRTLSLSCSDKMAKWNAVGIQGALLSRLIPPIRMKSFCIGGRCPYSLEAMERGIFDRFAPERQCPIIMRSERSFLHKKEATRTQPCPSSIIWSAVPERELEITVDGRKQGVTKKKTKGNYLLVCRQELFKTFLKTIEKSDKISHIELNHPKKITYLDAKQSSATYQRSWKYLKSHSFQAWPKKPSNLQKFVLTSCCTFI